MVGVKEYHRPKTVKEAVELLKRHGKKAKLIAGGTDLMVLLRAEKATPEHLVSINAIPGLRKLTFTAKGGLSIGPLVTYSDLLAKAVACEHYPILAQAAAVIGARQVQNVGTIVGNLCHASPSADMGPPLLALDAQVEISGPAGARTLPLQKFFLGPNQTALRAGEMVTAVLVPPPARSSGSCFLKHGLRGQLEIAMVSAGVCLAMRNGAVARARVALGAVAPVPMRAEKAEKLLTGQPFSDGLCREAAASAAKECKPITDFRCSAEYRREMVEVFTRRALQQAAKVAQAG